MASLEEIFTEVPGRSSQQPESIEAAEINTYLHSLQGAYDSANLRIGTRDAVRRRPTQHIGNMLLQVGLTASLHESRPSGLLVSSFIVLEQETTRIVQGVTTTLGRRFDASGSHIMNVTEGGDRELWYFTPGEEGSMAWLADAIKKAEFHPEETIMLEPWEALTA